jgi:hypothetical protein
MIPEIIQAYLALPESIGKQSIQKFLDEYSDEEQMLLVACMYIGREHMRFSHIQQPTPQSAYQLDRKFIDYIHKDDYANILYGKYSASRTYLRKIIDCAVNSNFNLSQI